MCYVIAYNRHWCRNLSERLEKKTGKNFVVIDNKKDLNRDHLNSINPKHIFFPHWSYIIPDEIFENFNCIIFHMTDLPYGRGGSPLQNLIIRGHTETMISAIQCVKEIDAGPVYLKKPLSLEGTADEIFLRSAKIIEDMIVNFTTKELKSQPQKGEVVKFVRRKPEQSNLKNIKSINQIFDYIRMLDAEGYPKAFLDTNGYKYQFSDAEMKKNSIIAKVEIMEKKHE